VNVQNVLLHDTACVIKHRLPPEWKRKLCKFQERKRRFSVSANSMPQAVEGVSISLDGSAVSQFNVNEFFFRGSIECLLEKWKPNDPSLRLTCP